MTRWDRGNALVTINVVAKAFFVGSLSIGKDEEIFEN